MFHGVHAQSLLVHGCFLHRLSVRSVHSRAVDRECLPWRAKFETSLLKHVYTTCCQRALGAFVYFGYFAGSIFDVQGQWLVLVALVVLSLVDAFFLISVRCTGLLGRSGFLVAKHFDRVVAHEGVLELTLQDAVGSYVFLGCSDYRGQFFGLNLRKLWLVLADLGGIGFAGV